MSFSEGGLHQGEDLEATLPNPKLQAKQERLREDLKDIAEQNNAPNSEVAPVAAEQERAERMQRVQDNFFAEGGISGYWANNMWIVENAVGKYLSFKSAEAAFEAQKQSADRLAKREQEAAAKAPEAQVAPQAKAALAPEAAPRADAATVKQSEAPAPELSAEAVRAKEAMEDRVLGSASREINNTLFGRITVKAQGETLSYASREEYEAARQEYLTRKEQREAAAREAAPTEEAQTPADARAQMPIEVPTQKPVERQVEPVADAQSAQQPAAEKEAEEGMTPERAEMMRLNKEATDRFQGLDRTMVSLRSLADRELDGLMYGARGEQNGALQVMFRVKQEFIEAMNRSSQRLYEAQNQARVMNNIDGQRMLIEQTKQEALVINRAYEDMARQLMGLRNNLRPDSRLGFGLEDFYRKSRGMAQYLPRLAQ